MDLRGKTEAFFANNTNIGDPWDKKLDLVVAICLPTLDERRHASCDQLWWNTSLRVKYVMYSIASSTFIDSARNNIAGRATEKSIETCARPPDYFLWIDEDMVVPPELFMKLRAHDKDIVSANYVRKSGFGWCFEPAEEYKDWESKPGGLIECDYIGFGAVLVKGEVFEKLEYPWFKVERDWKVIDGKREYMEVGEDVYFCRKAREAGFSTWVDTGLEVGHMGATIWPKDAYVMHGNKSVAGVEK